MKNLCKFFGVEEGEEFKIEYNDGIKDALTFKIIENNLYSRLSKDDMYILSSMEINIIKSIKNIIKLPKKKKFSQDELYILNNIDKKYKWIAKDKDGLICTFVSKPIKTEKLWSDGWSNGASYASLEAIKNSLFNSIQWEDEEPVYIDDYTDR